MSTARHASASSESTQAAKVSTNTIHSSSKGSPAASDQTFSERKNSQDKTSSGTKKYTHKSNLVIHWKTSIHVAMFLQSVFPVPKQ